MTAQRDDPASRDRRLQDVLQAYLQAVDAGQRPDTGAVLARHPDLADELSAFFADQRKLDELARSLQGHGPTLPPADRPTLGGREAPASGGLLGKVRYFGDYELLEEVARGGMGV